MKKPATCLILILFLALFSAFAAADMLEISDVTVKVDGDKQSADEDGGTIKVTPDSELSLEIRVENLYESGTDGGEIENIEIEAILQEIDDDSDLDEQSADFDLRPGRDKKVTIKFNIPLRLETDQTYKLIIDVTGEDKNNTDHEVHLEFDVDIDKENHELRFLKKELSPSKVTCGNSSTIQVELINTGEDDEDVELIIDGGEIYNKRFEFEMVEDVYDDENEYELAEKIDLEGVEPGIYPILVKALYRDGRETLEYTLNLEVEACETTTPPAPTPAAPPPAPAPEPASAPTTTPTTPAAEPAEVEVVSQPSTAYVRPASTAVATPRTTYTQKSWWDENKWLAVILITDLVLIIAGIIVVVAVLKRRK